MRCHKKIPVYLVPLFKAEIEIVHYFIVLGLIGFCIELALAVRLYFLYTKYYFVLFIALGDLGVMFMFCGIFLFMMVDVRAAESLVQSLEVVEKDLAVRHYELVRKEIKSREQESR